LEIRGEKRKLGKNLGKNLKFGKTKLDIWKFGKKFEI